jgi:chromosome segregation ATPase
LYFFTPACRQDATVKTARIQELEKAINGHQGELQHRQQQSKEYEERLSKLQQQATVENKRGEKLDQALQECQQELTAHIQQLDKMKDQHGHELDAKITEVRSLKFRSSLAPSLLNVFSQWFSKGHTLFNSLKRKPQRYTFFLQISELQRVLEQCKDDYRKKCKDCELLEQTLTERNELLKGNHKQISEQEINLTRLKQEAGILELELNRERETNREEVRNLQALLKNAKQDLDERARQLNEMNNSLVGVHKDMKQSSSHVVDLEQLLKQTRDVLAKKCEEANDLATSIKDRNRELSSKAEIIKQLEDTMTETKKSLVETQENLNQTKAELTERDSQVSKLDKELSRTQDEISDTANQLVELKSVLEESKKELREKDRQMDGLDDKLNRSEELLERKDREIIEKDAKVTELDQTVRECQWELKQRVSEVSVVVKNLHIISM